jgi:hypothetical protein
VRDFSTRLLAVVAATAVLITTVPGLAHAADAPAAGTRPASGYGLTGVDAMTATVFQEGQSSFSGLGIRARLHDARLLDNVEFLPTVEYWRNSSTVNLVSGNVSTVRRDAALSADARWMFPGEVWRAYAGAGLAVHFLSDQLNAPGLGLVDRKHSLTKGGLTLLGGVAFGTKSRVGNFIEVKGHLVGGFRQLKINMGLSWNH